MEFCYKHTEYFKSRVLLAGDVIRKWLRGRCHENKGKKKVANIDFRWGKLGIQMQASQGALARLSNKALMFPS